MDIGILGGTGKEGRGLALRWAQGGTKILLGSRDRAKAERVAGELNEILDSSLVRGDVNRTVAEQAGAVISTLPYSGHRQTLETLKEELEGKTLLVATVIWPPGTLDRLSAAEEAGA